MDKLEDCLKDASAPTLDLKPPPSSYKVLDTLGEGNFGHVMIAEHNETKQQVAIKILDKERIVTEGDVTRVQREIEILMKLSHPNIIRLYEVFFPS